MVSTLFFVLFSALFAQSMIKIVSTQMIQLNQLTNSYQAKAALNMGKRILIQEIEEHSYPSSGEIYTSIGRIEMSQQEIGNGRWYELTLITKTSMIYTDRIFFEIIDEEDIEEPLIYEDLSADAVELEAIID